MKIGFSKNGLTLNSREFDPLNMSVHGYGIESDINNKVDPFRILETFAAAHQEEDRLKKIKALQLLVKG